MLYVSTMREKLQDLPENEFHSTLLRFDRNLQITVFIQNLITNRAKHTHNVVELIYTFLFIKHL